MVSANTLCKQLLGAKSAVVTGHDFYQDSVGVNHLRIHAHLDKRHGNDCPFRHKRCRPYDVQTRLPCPVLGALPTGEGRWLRSSTARIVSCVRSTESSLQTFHGLIRGAALRVPLLNRRLKTA